MTWKMSLWLTVTRKGIVFSGCHAWETDCPNVWNNEPVMDRDMQGVLCLVDAMIGRLMAQMCGITCVMDKEGYQV